MELQIGNWISQIFNLIALPVLTALGVWAAWSIARWQKRSEAAQKRKDAADALEQMRKNSKDAVEAVEKLYGDKVPGPEKAKLALLFANQLNAITGTFAMPTSTTAAPSVPTILNEANVASLPDKPKEPKGEG